MLIGSVSPTQRQRVAHWVASLVYGVIVFAVIGSDGYFADPDTQVFAAAVALTSWAIGVVLLRRYLFRPFAPAVPTASQANRAIGAMFFCVFGGAWLTLWAHGFFAVPLPAYVSIAGTTAIFLILVHRIYRLHAPALSVAANTPEMRRRSRSFRIVNAIQWILILIVANVLANIGLASWVIPAAILIVGAHFIPLARLFHYPPHYVSGGAMMLLAAAYPFIAPAGADSPIGPFGAGVILWLSAAWAITRQGTATNTDPSHERQPGDAEFKP